MLRRISTHNAAGGSETTTEFMDGMATRNDHIMRLYKQGKTSAQIAHALNMKGTSRMTGEMIVCNILGLDPPG